LKTRFSNERRRGPALGSGEDEVVGPGAVPVGGQVLGQLVDEEGRDAEGPTRRAGLGVGHVEPDLDLGHGLADCERASQKGDVADS
jgi:hypothetical protein